MELKNIIGSMHLEAYDMVEIDVQKMLADYQRKCDTWIPIPEDEKKKLEEKFLLFVEEKIKRGDYPKQGNDVFYQLIQSFIGEQINAYGRADYWNYTKEELLEKLRQSRLR